MIEDHGQQTSDKNAFGQTLSDLNKIVLISWVEHPLKLPDHEREALDQYGIEWKEINWQLKELLGCKLSGGRKEG